MVGGRRGIVGMCVQQPGGMPVGEKTKRREGTGMPSRRADHRAHRALCYKYVQARYARTLTEAGVRRNDDPGGRIIDGLGTLPLVR